MPSPEKLLAPYLAGSDMRPNGDLDMHCPIHGDKRRSATVNFKTREWYCNGCEEGGSLSGLIRRRDEWHDPPLVPGGGGSGRAGRTLELPTSARLDGWQSALLSNESALDWLESQRGISLETIQRFGLGWDGKRYAMPIYDEAGVLRNVRCYSSVLEPKIINWTGHGSPPRLYPMAVLLTDPKTVVICEGEFDALLSNQQGIPTVTGTGGVKSTGKWKENWSEWFRGRSVYVCFDADRDGEINARRVVKRLTRYARRIKIIPLPFPMGSGKDLTDYLLDGGSFSALRKLGKPVKAVKHAAPRYRHIEYDGLREGKTIDKPVEFEATLSSIFRSQVSLPLTLKADCNMDWEPKRCAVCPMHALNGKMTHDVAGDHDLHIDIIGINKSEERERRFKRVMGIPVGCSMVELNVDNSSAWDAEVRNGSNLQEQAFPMLLFANKVPEVNYLYRWRGVPIASPRGGQTLFIARQHESAKQDLDNFEPDSESAGMAREWIDSFAGSPSEKMDAISEHFETHVTQIFGQRLLHVAMDLIYHSILEFKFGGKKVGRGWMEALAVGETRSGKSTTAQRLQDAFGYGQLKSGENTTVAGLLGGVEKKASLSKDGAWAVTAGELPLCDRRLLVIDEAQGLPVAHISQMSDVRSRGVVDIQKIRATKINARVRIIWLANGRKKLYKYGVDALSDQMGAEEDLARVDIPLYVSGDIGDELEKTRQHYDDLPGYEIEIIRWIVLWAWSRSEDQIRFSPAAEKAVHDLSVKLSEEYSTMGLPVLPRLEARIRLARMSAALAARLFASPDHQVISIKTEHVEGAYELYRRFFNDPRLGIIDIKEDEVATARAAEDHSKELRELLYISSPELVQKMAAGSFDRLTMGAMTENDSALSVLTIWKAVSYEKGNLTVNRWAKDIAQDVEKERFSGR